MSNKILNNTNAAVNVQRLMCNKKSLNIKNQPLLKNITSINNKPQEKPSFFRNLMQSNLFNSGRDHSLRNSGNITRSQKDLINYQTDLVEVAKVILKKSGHSDNVLNGISNELNILNSYPDRELKKMN
ncbi:hypothetical protein M2263_002722 [Providencia alcalifaciens]|nr:hypothetical protein [Providencia alcalifaciens]